MTIEKLTEFAKTGQKDTGQLDLETGFIVNKKPARQWFNWLFNTLTLKINEIIDADYVQKSNIVDNLTTDDATKPVSAKQAKVLNDQAFGVGQTYKNVTASRIPGTTYTNTTQKPIDVYLSVNDPSGSAGAVTITVDGLAIIHSRNAPGGESEWSFVVPKDSTYKFEVTGVNVVSLCVELS